MMLLKGISATIKADVIQIRMIIYIHIGRGSGMVVLSDTFIVFVNHLYHKILTPQLQIQSIVFIQYKWQQYGATKYMWKWMFRALSYACEF